MMTKTENKKRRLEGVVVSDKMTKTRVVAITRLKRHPKYLKFYKVTKRYKVHDEENATKTGEKVLIEESRPLSRDKRWKIIANSANPRGNNANKE